MQQAVCAPITGPRDCAPGISHISTDAAAGKMPTNSRRQMLLGLALLPAAAAAPAMAIAAAPSSLMAKVAAFRAAKARDDRYWKDVYEPAQAAWEAQVARIPHVTAEVTDSAGFVHVMSTEYDGDVDQARRWVKNVKSWSAAEDSFAAGCARIVAGAKAREEERKRLYHATGFAEVERVSELLDDAKCECLKAVEIAPAGSIQDLAAKVAVIDEMDQWDLEENRASIVADLNRLAGLSARRSHAL